MKKTIKTLIASLLAVLMLVSFTGCGVNNSAGDDETAGGASTDNKTSNSADIDYDTMIDSFVSDALNTFELTVGDEAAPQARLWLQDGQGTAYSSDENVVTVTDLGKVTAVGEGSAYVVITAQGGAMFQVYRYDVYAPAPEADVSDLPTIDGVDFAAEINNFNSTDLNTYKLKIGDSHTPTAAVWTGIGASCYTSDASVVTVADNGNVSAVGRGTAYVVIKAGIGDMYEIYKYVVNG